MHKEIADLDHQQCHMRTVGTAHLVEIMDDYDLLPTNNYKYGAHPEYHQIDDKVYYQRFTQGIPQQPLQGQAGGATMTFARQRLRARPADQLDHGTGHQGHERSVRSHESSDCTHGSDPGSGGGQHAHSPSAMSRAAYSMMVSRLLSSPCKSATRRP